MANTTETTDQSPLEWRIQEFDSRLGAGVRFTSPNGFHIELVGTSNVVRLLTKLAFRGNSRREIGTPDGSRFWVSGAAIILIDTEPWLNPDFQSAQIVGDTDGLVSAVGHYLLEQAWSQR